MTGGSKQIASPFSTGGGGDDLQSQVGAYYLAGLLLRHVPRGLDAGTLVEVRFQRLYQGEPMDDLVCIAETAIGPSKLALQIKKDLTFGEKDKLFAEVMTACWQTYTSPQFNRATNRFGIVLGVYQTKVDRHYQMVLSWARNSVNAAAFLERIRKERLSHQNHRDFVALVRSKLTACQGKPVSDDDLWGFLRSMVILHFDLQEEGSRDRTHAVNCLRYALQQGATPGAVDLLSRLNVLSAEANRTAGEYTYDNLVQRLLPEGFRLVPSPDCRDDLARLDALRDHILDDIHTDIGGLTLNRVEAVDAAQGQFADADLVLLIGPPGVGKSGIWKALVEKHRLGGPAIVLSADRIEGKGWPGFAHTHGLTRNAEELLLAVSTHAAPCVFIDGIDRIEDGGARLAVNDLLRTAQKVLPPLTGRRQWWCIATAREGSLDSLAWLDRRIVRQLATVRVPELDDEEVRLVLGQQPRLRALISQQRLQPVLKNPFMLDLLTDQRMAAEGATTVPATEVEVSNVWWERLIGRSGQPEGRERQQTLIEAARRLVAGHGRRFPDAGLPSQALVTLESDRVLLRDPGQNVYRFTHDLLEDWSLLRLLEQRRDDLPAFLRELGQPRGLLRAVQLLGCMVLERGQSAEEWTRLLRSVEQVSDLTPRWRQAVLTAPFLSTRLEELLDMAKAILLEGDARRLIDLLVALRTAEVDQDPQVAAVVASVAKSPEEAFTLALRYPLPRWYAWWQTLRWLLRHATAFNPAVRHEMAQLMEVWQEKTAPGDPLRREIGELALAWLQEAEED